MGPKRAAPSENAGHGQAGHFIWCESVKADIAAKETQMTLAASIGAFLGLLTGGAAVWLMLHASGVPVACIRTMPLMRRLQFHVSFTRLKQLPSATSLKLVDETIGELIWSTLPYKISPKCSRFEAG